MEDVHLNRVCVYVLESIYIIRNARGLSRILLKFETLKLLMNFAECF